jgi:hypothetical protein
MTLKTPLEGGAELLIDDGPDDTHPCLLEAVLLQKEARRLWNKKYIIWLL